MDSYTLHVHVPFWSIQRAKRADLPTFFSAPAIRVCMYVDLSLLCSHIHVQHVHIHSCRDIEHISVHVHVCTCTYNALHANKTAHHPYSHICTCTCSCGSFGGIMYIQGHVHNCNYRKKSCMNRIITLVSQLHRMLSLLSTVLFSSSPNILTTSSSSTILPVTPSSSSIL